MQLVLALFQRSRNYTKVINNTLEVYCVFRIVANSTHMYAGGLPGHIAKQIITLHTSVKTSPTDRYFKYFRINQHIGLLRVLFCLYRGKFEVCS